MPGVVLHTLGSCCALNLNLASRSLASLEVTKEQSRAGRGVPSTGFGCSEHPGTSLAVVGAMDAPKALMLYPNCSQLGCKASHFFIPSFPLSCDASYLWRHEGCRFGTVDFSTSPSAILTTVTHGQVV